MSSAVTVALSKSNFNTGLRYAKQVGGKYDPQTKTWAIPANRPELGAPAAYGWMVVEQIAQIVQPPVVEPPVVEAPVADADQVAVERFVAPATAATPAQRGVVLGKLEAMIARGERCGDGKGGWTSVATMREAARRIRQMEVSR